MPNKIKKPFIKRFRSGSVLPFAVTMVVLLFIIGLGLMRLGLGARLACAKTTAQLTARAAADAGFIQAMRLMNARLASKPWDGSPIAAVSDVPLAGADATFSYTVTDAGSYYQIASTGKSGSAQRTVYGRLAIGSLLFGIGVKDIIDVKVGAIFNAPADSGFAIRTNSVVDNAIVLKSGVTIPGDVICGPGGNTDDVVNIKSSTVITGETYSAMDEIDFPPVVLPADLQSTALTNYNYVAGTPIIGSVDPANPRCIKLDNIDIPNGGVQRIQGHCKIYVVGTTTLRQSAELIVDSGASMQMYLGGNMVAGNSNGLDNLNTNLPEALTIYGLSTCTQMDLKAKGDVFFGYVYVPDAALRVYAKNTLAGAFVGKSFTLTNSASFTFIPPTNTDDNDPDSYLFLRWWEE